MSAQQIPNLLDSLRAPKNARGTHKKVNNLGQRKSADDIVRGTDDDAAISRLSAVEAGYLEDPFARDFLQSQDPPRRMPIINRGTFVRTKALDELALSFLNRNSSRNCQIVSLGAGTDTRCFRFLHKDVSLRRRLQYYELDFRSTTTKKAAAMQHTPLIQSLLENASDPQMARVKYNLDQGSVSSHVYSLHPMDLRSLASQDEEDLPDLSHLNSGSPTLILSEMCLTYLEPKLSSAVLETVLKNLTDSTNVEILLYEPLNPQDAFGRTMIQNLASRGITLAGLNAFPTVQAHEQRLHDVGFTGGAESWTQKEWWDQRVAEEEKERLRHCEMVDEEEEWVLLASHYGLIRAWR